MTKKVNFKLKKVIVDENLSEETTCFSADLYENDMLIAHIKNRGFGGSNDITPAKGLKYKDVAHLDNINTELDIFNKVEEIHFVNKKQKDGFITLKNGKHYIHKFPMPISKLKKHPQFKMWLNRMKDSFKKSEYEILNTNLPL